MHERFRCCIADPHIQQFFKKFERYQSFAINKFNVFSEQQLSLFTKSNDLAGQFSGFLQCASFESEDNTIYKKQLSQQLKFEFNLMFLDLQQSDKLTEIKSPKTTLNIMSIPLSGSNKTQNLKFKQIQQRASGILMQRCESHQTLNQQSKKQEATATQDGSLSPISKTNLQRTIKHNRQSSIVNFNFASNKGQQKSLSPCSDQQIFKQKKQQSNHGRQHTERVKSLDNESLEAISRAIANGSYEYDSIEKQKRMAQIIRISPQKQFIVQSCTQHTSPKELKKKNQLKLQLRNPPQEKNLILEQEDYLLPVQDDISDYSINREIKKQVHHDYNMVKQHHNHQQKDSEESVNKGFLTDRGSSNNDIRKADKKQKKTKGISYTRNAQELKKLLLESGVLGKMSFVGQSSLATAAAGMISQTQDTQIKIDQHQNKENEVFCFSARNKSNKQFTVGTKEKSTCLLEKKNFQRVQQQLESSVQTQLPGSNVFYQTLDQHQSQFPQSATNQNLLREFILQDDDELVQQNQVESDQVVYKKYTPSNPHKTALRKSPSSLLRDSQNFPFQETEQFISKNTRTTNYTSLAIPDQKAQQKTLTRCYTAAEDFTDKQSYYNLGEIHIKSRQTDIYRQQSDKSPKSSLKYTTTASSKQLKNCKVKEYQGKQMINNLFSTAISNENVSDNLPPPSFDVKELEIMKFKMIAFVKTYENEFRKMKSKMNDLEKENKGLKKKINTMQKRRMSTNSQNTQYSSIALTKGFSGPNPYCMTSTHTSQIHI